MPETTVERPHAVPAAPALPLWRRGPVVVAFSMIMVFVSVATLLIWQATQSDWRRQLPPVDGVTVTTSAAPAGAGSGEVTRP